MKKEQIDITTQAPEQQRGSRRVEVFVSRLNIACFGGGVNSTAMILKMYESGTPIDLVLFADTKAERPDTYKFISIFNDFLIKHNLPEITAVSVKGESLYENCLRRKALPSLAYGFKTCSMRFKHDPQNKFLNNYEPAKQVWRSGKTVNKYIGFDAGESHRVKNYDDPKYTIFYPLVDAQMMRDDCKDIIHRHGLPVPGKSSCYFCPAMKKSEITELAKHYPDLIDNAIMLEENADLSFVKGLGRNFAWKELLSVDQIELFDETIVDAVCECYDG